MQKLGYGSNRHIEARITTSADDAISAASQGLQPTADVLSLFRSGATERPPSSAEGSKRPPITETFVGSVEAARAEARQIINEPRPMGYTRIIEGWQQLPDGHIQFTIRRLLR